MALVDYWKKRDFSKTPEPQGDAPEHRRKTGALRFVVQRHDARRLHYDFRLEIGGVLKSWAVPRGPSLDPRERRLAIETEDHPLEYIDFEGKIPEGQYGAGTVEIWDRGTWTPEGSPEKAYENGVLKFTLHGRRLRGGWVLIRMAAKGREKNWLLIKERDAEPRPDSGAAVVRNDRTSVVGARRPASEAPRRRMPAASQASARSSPDTAATPRMVSSMTKAEDVDDHDPLRRRVM
jgi:bifunctional non-homologous end joining protein LigD